MTTTLLHLIFGTLMAFCSAHTFNSTETAPLPEAVINSLDTLPFVVVLGTAQDAGYPQAGCPKSCCTVTQNVLSQRRNVSCLAIVDPSTSERWMIDATPDFREQLDLLNRVHPVPNTPGVNGIFLTHAHMGHYTGLIHLGREAINARELTVYAMPRMVEFLSHNGPWDQLVRLKNISVQPIQGGQPIRLNDRISVTALRVPHRDEYTETVGYRIEGPHGSALYIPDIDKWDRWDVSITDLISEVSVAFLDGTFFDDGEVPGRDMADIPHPFIMESIIQFETLSDDDRSKVRFIHLNHTNPALVPGSDARNLIAGVGMRVAEEGERFTL
jgi:pyrroloquinoline quinone biosynthesis protein B